MQLVIKYSFIIMIVGIGLVSSFLLYKVNRENKVKQYQTAGVLLAITYYFVIYLNKRISNNVINIKETINILLIVMIALTILLKYLFKIEVIKDKKIDLAINLILPLITISLFIINILIK